LKNTRKHERIEGGIEPRNKAARLWRTVRPGGADCPARRGGLSAKAARTVRQGIADCPHPCRGPSGLSRGLFEKDTRTSRDAPRITDRPQADCPPGTHGPSAQHTRTVRNFTQPKLENTADRKRSRARTQRTRDEHTRREPSARSTRTVREARTEQKTARPRRSTPPIHHRISQTVEAVETRVWGQVKRQTRMLYPKNFASQLSKSPGIADPLNTTKS
jgi:hypothetical protein